MEATWRALYFKLCPQLCTVTINHLHSSDLLQYPLMQHSMNSGTCIIILLYYIILHVLLYQLIGLSHFFDASPIAFAISSHVTSSHIHACIQCSYYNLILLTCHPLIYLHASAVCWTQTVFPVLEDSSRLLSFCAVHPAGEDVLRVSGWLFLIMESDARTESVFTVRTQPLSWRA